MGSAKNFNRRHFLSMAALTFTAAKLAPLNALASTGSQHSDHYKSPGQLQTSFNEIKQIRAGQLSWYDKVAHR
jgi:hypothetical protein